MTPPRFFNDVADSARKLWDQLDDPALAGPWRQLFKQVQSPRHVLSELLQNADDARAKSASVRITNDEFIFEHDGEDFSKDQFQSLCRFGFSNKRNLHTIGFRGVGFKSTFSLGKSVRVQTPTLDVVFQHERFTLPLWNKNAASTPLTRISVPVADKRQLAQLRMNFEEWATSPASLLFFRHLRELKLESHTIRKEAMGRGPTPGSSRIRLVGAKTQELLLFTSSEEAFPEDVLNEIRQERNADDLNLPPCCVDLVLGLDGEQALFTVLPAGTAVELPFSINAPLLQDPARQRIKEPEISPCNRWLLQRAGKLAGEAMVGWLANEQLGETFQWLLVPTQPSPQAAVEWQQTRLTGSDALAVRASKKLRNDGQMVSQFTPTFLRQSLDSIPLWRGNHTSVKQLVEDFARYPYLQRLRDMDVLLSSMREGVSLMTWRNDTFAFAESFDETNKRYLGLRAGQVLGFGADAVGLLVKPTVADAQLEAERLEPSPKPAGAGAGTPGSSPIGGRASPGASSGGAATVAAVVPPTYFFGSAKVDAARISRDVGTIANEIIQHLASLPGSTVSVTVEIQARVPGGIPGNVVRTVSENCRTLKFTNQGFEKE